MKKKKRFSISDICMYLEKYTDIKYSHDDIECGSFAEACILVLEKNNASQKNEELLKRLDEIKGMNCNEIGEELCNEFFAAVTSGVKNKKKLLKKIIPLCLAVLILICIIINLIYLPNYIKNKTFNNGIQGTYYCTETLVTFAAQAEGYSKDSCDYVFLGQSIKIDEDGVLSELDILGDCPLKYADDYFSLDKSYILYKPEEEYKGYGFMVDDFFLNSAYFNKRGAQISAGRNAETDQIELYIAAKDVNANFAIVLTFEKKYY